MIELNGVANIKILVDQIAANDMTGDPVLVPVAKIYQQLDLLERYMIEVEKAAREGRNPAYWHDVRDNKKDYPLNRDVK